jgi:hypothetical protein
LITQDQGCKLYSERNQPTYRVSKDVIKRGSINRIQQL